MRSGQAQRRGGGAGSGIPAGLRQAHTGETWEYLGEAMGKGEGVVARMRLPPLYIG